MKLTKVEQCWLNISIMSFYTALKDNENIENDEILSLTKSLIESETGITVALMKKIIEDSYKPVDYELVRKEASTKTIKELADEFDISPDAIRSYFRRNDIEYKHSSKRGGNICSSMS